MKKLLLSLFSFFAFSTIALSLDANVMHLYVTILQKKAQFSDAQAQLELARCYHSGTGVECNRAESLKWRKMAAEQGLAEAQFTPANCYYAGEGVEKNYQEAAKWYRKAAEQGHAVARYMLTRCYNNGAGVDNDKQEALK